jgi:GT2 family glycosyltransferase
VNAIVICTRNRAAQLRRTLEALAAQGDGSTPIVVVDQSDAEDAWLSERERADARLTVIRDSGRGLARARNIGWRRSDADWLIYLDDDCLPEPGWLEALEHEIRENADADYVSCAIAQLNEPGGDYKAYSVFSVPEHRRLEGRWTQPSSLGYGACYAVRREVVERLGGWDERLGAGVPDFPASDDMDFNFRLMRAGGVAYLTPRGRVLHDQWRDPADLPAHYRGYMAAACGYAMKHLKQGDVRGGLWLWSNAMRDLTRAFASAAKHRSRLRLSIALAKLAGFLIGTAKGIARDWSGPEMAPVRPSAGG